MIMARLLMLVRLMVVQQFFGERIYKQFDQSKDVLYINMKKILFYS